MSIWDFVASPDSARVIADATLLSDALLHGPRDWRASPRSMPFGGEFGIYGAGVVLYQNRLAPALLVSTSQVPARMIRPLSETGNALRACQILFRDGIVAFAPTVAFGVEEPRAYVSPGNDVNVATGGGLGVQIQWGSTQGMLTAGHVGKPAGADAYSAGTKIGSVRVSLDPGGGTSVAVLGGMACSACGHVMASPGLSPQPDVAVIELVPGVPVSRRITTAVPALPADAVDIPTPRGTVSSQIMGKMLWLWMPSTTGTYGDVYITTNEVTLPGDSGSPALRNGNIVGHAIGGSTGCTTYIQDFDYQLRHIRGQAGLASARL